MLDILDKILELLENKDFPQLGNLLKDMNPADVAELFEDLPREKMALVFRLLPKELAADAFAYMNPDEQTVLVEAFSDKELHDVVNELYVDDAADMIEEMPANLVKRILRHTDAETRVLINQILNYPKDSAGSIMTMEYVDLKRGMTVEEALSFFENQTRKELEAEIRENHREKLMSLEAQLKQVTAANRETSDSVQAKTIAFTDEYGPYIGKEFMDQDRLDKLIDILNQGLASNVTEAQQIYKNVK